MREGTVYQMSVLRAVGHGGILYEKQTAQLKFGKSENRPEPGR
jgi:hypothetical protein